MIETSRNRLRIRCDVDGCERFFRPLRKPVFEDPADTRTEARKLRDRAELYGWRVELDELVLSVIDLCPEHAK